MERSSFFNSVSKDRRYKAEDWARYFASFIGNGVFPLPSSGLQVVAGTALSVAVRPGKAWINGYFYENTSDLTVALPVADGVLKRIDRIVVRWDLTDRAVFVAVKSSTPSDAPVAPALQRDADAYELCLADVLIAAGATTISQAAITDQRLNSSLCGVVAAVVNQIDTEAFNAQLQAWFRDYMALSTEEFNRLASYMGDLKQAGDTEYADLQAYFTEHKQQSDVGFSMLEAYLQAHKDQSDVDYIALVAWFNNFKTQSEGDFNIWFENLKDVLDENAATNLMNIITQTQQNVMDAMEALDTSVSNRLNEQNRQIGEQIEAQNGSISNQLSEQNQTVANLLSEQNQSVTKQLADQDQRVNNALGNKQNALNAADYVLFASAWTARDDATDDKWQQTINVPGLLAAYNFAMTYSPASKYQCQAVNVSALDTTEDGKVTFVCSDKPDVDLAVRIELREVNT